ncbi:unnamed protein product [Cochlearia groenlandica]
MGNCICVKDKTTRRRSTVFHDDDDEEKLLGKTPCSETSSSCVKREVKITMTRKEFEELMRNIQMKGLSTEEVLSKLLFDGGDQIGSAVDVADNHQRSWRPALQSIPEID